MMHCELESESNKEERDLGTALIFSRYVLSRNAAHHEIINKLHHDQPKNKK